MLGRALALVLLSAVVACTHGRLEPAATRIPAPLGRVDVGTAPDLPADRLERYRELDGDRVIREAIESELADGGLSSRTRRPPSRSPSPSSASARASTRS